MSPDDALPSPPEHLNVVTRFARALDEEDYATALALLDAACAYTIRDETLHGPEAIIASYKGNGDEAAQKFDKISYESAIRSSADGWIIITYTDHLQHAGQSHTHTCEQWVKVNPRKLIIRIDHHDLPGERERLEAFKRSVGATG